MLEILSSEPLARVTSFEIVPLRAVVLFAVDDLVVVVVPHAILILS